MAEKPTIQPIDRSELKPKTRVHALAKQLGTTSRIVVEQLAELGLKKVAQSTLSVEEQEQLLDALSSDNEKPKKKPAKKPAKKTTKKTAKKVTKKAEEKPAEKADEPQQEETTPQDVEKIRRRVEANVKNEIHQIEEKVERELAEEAENQDSQEVTQAEEVEAQAVDTPVFQAPQATDSEDETVSRPRRRGRRGTRRGRGNQDVLQDNAAQPAPEQAEEPEVVEKQIDEPVALKGSTRLEARRRRRNERREEVRKERRIVSQAEFLARRESVKRVMVVRERERTDHVGNVTQVGVLEDDMLVEHFVTSEAQASMIGNIYLGRVQNVLPSMEAAFIDIGQGRNGVLYAGDVDWRKPQFKGSGRRIEKSLKSGDQVIVQVSKDPIGHKGARLTTQISLAGRFLVYVPGGKTAGISRKLPAPERKRLKDILKQVMPDDGGSIIRTAAEGVSAEAIGGDVARLHAVWEDIQERARKAKNPKGHDTVTLYEEPDMLVKVIRDVFNEDFSSLVVDGEKAWNTVRSYVSSVAPDLLDRVEKYDRSAHDGEDAFATYRIDEQIHKALSRMVWLTSGGSLVIDRTEAMTVIDVNTGRFTGSGGNLEETVTRNNLEAAEEIVRQLRLRDIGGMVVIDFIDMVLPENRDLVLRRLKEALGRDRTRHQVSEVTSLGLVQLTRKRLGTGLLESFSTTCECCDGRGVVIHEDPVEKEGTQEYADADAERKSKREKSGNPQRKRSSKKELEDLAASVIVTDGEEEPEKEEEATDERDNRESGEDRGGRSRRDRRGQRRSNRSRRDTHEDSSDIADIVSSALEKAEEEDPDEPSGRDYQSALDDFEASPRRRRKTRGNSKSDHRPRKEDFEEKPTERDDASLDSGEPEDEGITRGRRRGRRRVVRRTAKRGEQSRGRGARRSRGSRSSQGSEQQVPESSTQKEATPQRRGRRRRVVRRRSN
ncbi:Ribonuclease E/G family [Corynebacterium renale]|uniref:translation initiation factor IF-2 N-terminal domain-containing protein n=1 Tax=Corynebacterium renale TaxID=1724 RepID=UPI000DA2A296|nr:translation initiation factor IF-2 N-terminal domain-containing protein [Corynebacterium renale]SQG65194.1 Ribonuclease E/G family [Corynebacterium renale]STC98271.1 Ribonuclease E/G family [Corynebacterium renale]